MSTPIVIDVAAGNSRVRVDLFRTFDSAGVYRGVVQGDGGLS